MLTGRGLLILLWVPVHLQRRYPGLRRDWRRLRWVPLRPVPVQHGWRTPVPQLHRWDPEQQRDWHRLWWAVLRALPATMLRPTLPSVRVPDWIRTRGRKRNEQLRLRKQQHKYHRLWIWRTRIDVHND
jgi:hypothetical protein